MKTKKESISNLILLVLEKAVDGYCRVVRNLFRRRLKDWEFRNWQRSVWITKKNVTQKLRELISDLEIDQWVAVVESNDPALHNIILNDRIT